MVTEQGEEAGAWKPGELQEGCLLLGDTWPSPQQGQGWQGDRDICSVAWAHLRGGRVAWPGARVLGQELQALPAQVPQ